MPLTKFEILARSPYCDGKVFGNVGAYERIDAIVHYAVEPTHLANVGITDLEIAERGDDGRVHFSGDATVLRPMDLSAGNGALLMQVPNRGYRDINRLTMAPVGTTPTADIPPGDGFLFQNGWSVAWAGWQWDVPRSPEQTRIGLKAPQVASSARMPAGQIQMRFQPNTRCSSIFLTDQHIGETDRHLPVHALDVDESNARLLVRERPYQPPHEIPKDSWRFAHDQQGAPVADSTHIWLDSGFQPGLIYDVLYTPRECPVVGAGLLATRDFASFLRYDSESPLDAGIQNVIGEGHSQCARFLRAYLHLGLNLDELDRPVLDGILAHVAGGRRGEFNHRYGQPSVQPTPSLGHLFPFADEPQTDPSDGLRAGLLDLQRSRGGVPRIFFTDTSAEYWRGDAGLTHTNLATDGDITPPDEVRRYLFSSTQHGIGLANLSRCTSFGSTGANLLNIVDYRPLYRAALANLLAWVVNDVQPPPNDFPRADAANRVRRAALIDSFARIPCFEVPDPEMFTTMFPLDLGPDARLGLPTLPATIAGPARPDWVSAVDDDGNELAGISMPDVSVPVATHTGFNPRNPGIGGCGQLLEYVGSSVPFALDAAARAVSGDPRPSIAERYASREDYLARIRDAALGLVERRYLLSDDVKLCIHLAAERYDLIVAWASSHCPSSPKSRPGK